MTDLPPEPTTATVGGRTFTLRRVASDPFTPAALVNGRQDWKLFEGDEVVAELWDVCPPDRRTAVHVLHGDLRGEELTVATRRSLRARRRFVEFRTGGRRLRIEARPFGRRVRVRHRLDDDREAILLGLLEASGAEPFLLDSPLRTATGAGEDRG
ncbi:hypothetical protein QNO07_16500 [Streptomyces sp. 549]|uniref:hypothetical protein n=1 Tax=Streptomyces sp. 549 TaxID=3049076 RepID=UPI0024C30956|nr:hypothetical protein [Streptomyces sp. 549]MDK1474998.1 hypothetical protein [Streptomyces sp. 549]